MQLTFMSAITLLFDSASGAFANIPSSDEQAVVASASSAFSTRQVNRRSSFLH